MLEFDGVYRAVRVEFDLIRLADQVKAVAPHRQSALNPNARLDIMARRVDKVVHGLAARRVDVVFESLLLVNQCALARTVGPVLEGGERDGIRIVHSGGGTISVHAP